MIVLKNNGDEITEAAEREALDRFVAAFLAKKNVLPAGHWRVPGVGYCVFLHPVSE